MDSSLSSADSDDEGIGDKEKKKILKKKKKKKRVRVSSLAGRCAAPEGPAWLCRGPNVLLQSNTEGLGTI